MSEDDDDSRRNKKVTGVIDLGKLPSIAGFLLWRSGVRDEVSAVYENTQAAFAYVLALEHPDATLESMGQFPNELTQLDAKLTKAINLMMLGLTTDLAKRLYNLKESYIKTNGQKIKGRQLMWVIYQFFAVDPSAGVLFGVEDLLDVTLIGNKLDEFLAEWDRTLIHMTDPPAPALRDALFIKQVKGCSKLKTEWDNYYKAPVGSETRALNISILPQCWSWSASGSIMLVNKSPVRDATPWPHPVIRGMAKVKGKVPSSPTPTARHGT